MATRAPSTPKLDIPLSLALSAAQWTAFMAALDAPPRSLPRLERLFLEAGPFDPPAPGR